MRKGAIRENYFATRIVDDGFIASEPDNFRSINEVFTKDEYLNLY